HGTENRGAALIIAVAIFTILIAVALTFYSSSKLELQTATNVENSFRTDLIANAGIAIAVSHLQNDAELFPEATSLDHPWTSFFNGAYIAGKPWAFIPPGGIDPPEPWVGTTFPTSGTTYAADRLSVPYVLYDDVLTMQAEIAQTITDALDPTSLNLPLVARLQHVKAPLYVPRFQEFPTLADLEAGDFLIDYAFDPESLDALNPDWDRDNPADNAVTPQQQVAGYADVDNDGDGLQDSIWIPIPVESFYGGFDKDGDGRKSVEEGGDGLDNDLDGEVDEPDEVATFVYWGGNDALDNDRDGDVDEDDERKVFLTTPILDQDGNRLFDTLTVQADQTTLTEFVWPYVPGGPIDTTVENGDNTLDSDDIDRIDNDYSLVVSDGKGYGYTNPAGTEATWSEEEKSIVAQNRVKSYANIDANVYTDINSPYEVVTHSGEPVCQIAGRVAVLITDESSKINLNTAGSQAVGPGAPGVTDDVRLTWAINEAIGTQEIDLRPIPNFDVATGLQVAQQRNGMPADMLVPFPEFPLRSNLPDYDPANPVPAIPVSLDYDIRLPGYGNVDDNGNALTLMLNGIDDDGDAFYYLSDGINNDAQNGTDAGDPNEYFLGIDELWEGIDEPAEHQLYRPLRNTLAETDALDNDQDGSFDEIGEFGDRLYRTKDQIINVSGIGTAKTQFVRNVTTTQSTDRNQRSQYYTRDDAANLLQQLFPPLSGLKLDYNYALADNVALALKEDWDYPAFTDLLVPQPETLYAKGLRREDTRVVNAPYGLLDPVTGDIIFDADAELRAYQMALNLQEHRDLDHATNEATVFAFDDWWTVEAGGSARQIAYKLRGVESIRINELMVRAVRRVEAESQDGVAQFNPNFFSDLSSGVEPDDFDVAFELLSASYPETTNGADWQLNSPANGNARLGERTAIASNATQISNGVDTYDNVIQFRFGPSAQLPPGRYYLMFNSTAANGHPTVHSESDIEFRVKYATAAENDIIADVLGGVRNPFTDGDLSDTVSDNPVIGTMDGTTSAGPVTPANPASGWVLLPTRDAQPAPPVGFEGYAGTGGLTNDAFTVIIPPYTSPQVYLFVAISNEKGTGFDTNGTDDDNDGVTDEGADGLDNDGDGTADEFDESEGTLAVNFFDFSQEPDHEWVEITNIAEGDLPVDLSGWQLEVGGDINDRGRSLFRVPTGTQIAPGGSLLLGFNKYDVGSQNFEIGAGAYNGLRDFYKNGIGLVRGPAGGGLATISEPPIPRYSDPGDPDFLPAYYGAVWGISLGNAAGGDSVFLAHADGVNFADFVDRNGDGLVDGPTSDDLWPSSNDTPPLGIVTGAPAAAPATKAWDRIIQLEPIVSGLKEVGADEDDQLQNVARMVLGGGVFPNYPEFDLIDNDRDESAVDVDGIDNDGDGIIDEGADGIDNGGLPGIDDEAESEGFDDGRYRRVRHMNGIDDDGDGIVDNILERTAVPGAFEDELVDFGVLGAAAYMVGDGTFPDWKDLVERRFFPGDNVVVTLYQGSADSGNIADRVTYNQTDVENRAFDDEVPCPYPVDELANENFVTTWPANTMGIDFYRSLERRHPLLTGDRVGTQNRWLATDGSYDDWYHGTNRFFIDPTTSTLTRILDSGGDVLDGADNDLDTLIDEGAVRFGHGLSGSPLRANLFQRIMQEPVATLTTAAVTVDPLVGPYTWTFDRAKVRNRTLSSLGDVMTLPHMTLVKTLANNGLELLGAEQLPGQGVMIGRDYPKDLRAVLETGRLDSIELSVAQADFYPLYPRLGHITGQPDLIQFDYNTAGTSLALDAWPRGWAPVFLTSLDPAGFEPPFGDVTTSPNAPPPFYTNLKDFAYPIQLNFLFNPIVTYNGLTPALLLQDPVSPSGSRWPLDRRAVMYVSMNPQDFDPFAASHDAATPVALTTDHPSEALFVWDGADALPNGEYDLYVVTLDNIEGLVAPNSRLASQASELVPPFVNRAREAEHAVTAVDIEVLTDTNGDRRCWEDGAGATAANNLPDRDELGQTPALTRPENYGLKTGLTPASDGTIHYGVVKVENNFLAVFLRNWAPNGTVNRVSRVILTTRDKTPGRLNINTVTTRMINTAVDDLHAFNPLTCLPGIFGEFYSDDPLTAAYDPSFDVRRLVDPDAGGPGIAINDAGILPAQLRYAAPAGAADPLGLNDPLGRSERTGAVTTRGESLSITSGGVPKQFFFDTTDRLDGRYYLYQSELVAWGDNLLDGPLLTLSPGFLAPYPDPLEPGNLTADQLAHFDQMRVRYGRMANLITARSDVFEIIVTAQSGYGFDADNDGLINWRDPAEFRVNGEKKTRTVYER
ncbi:MAG: lamin tail domain-containing protein, partial [Candidatus Hydrogenedentes bacterium]|nr:lamin tail domain-containing protein [Candidatus Hydrogenedentota bacterium]